MRVAPRILYGVTPVEMPLYGERTSEDKDLPQAINGRMVRTREKVRDPFQPAGSRKWLTTPGRCKRCDGTIYAVNRDSLCLRCVCEVTPKIGLPAEVDE